MASNWYYKEDEQELGPYTFRDLVEMVREEKLTPGILVRPDYMNEWQRADSVVGLFHMAHRDPATLPPINETAPEQAEEFADVTDLESITSSEEVEKPGWLKRLLTIRSSKTPAAPLDPNREIYLSPSLIPGSDLDTLEESVDFESEHLVGSAEVNGVETEEQSHSNTEDGVVAGAYSDDTWSSAIGAAVERIDARAPKPEEEPATPKKMMPTISFSFLETPLYRKIIQAGGLVLCASLAIYGIVNWMGQGTLYFPLIGVCSPLMFLMYSAVTFLGVLVLGSLFIYFSASYLRLGFKLGAVILTTNLTIFSLLNWSKETVPAFPTRNADPVQAKFAFPLIGECSSFAYWMYFFDVVVFVAILTFFVAWWLEAHADDV